MLTPAILDLYNAAVASLAPDRAERERVQKESVDAHYTVVAAKLTRAINALEKGDLAAVKDAMTTAEQQIYGPTFALEAFSDALFDLCYPAPDTTVESPVTPAAITGTFGSTDPFTQGILDRDLPPSEPPAVEPEPAAAEPIPEPAVTPAEPTRKKRSR